MRLSSSAVVDLFTAARLLLAAMAAAWASAA